MLAGAPSDSEPDGARAPGMGVLALVGSHLAMVPAGASQALYGPSMPELAVRYGLASGELGLIIAAHSLGTVVGIAGWVVAGARPHPSSLSGVGVGLLGLGLLMVALAPTWALTLAGASLVGAGFGSTVVTINMWSTRAYDRHRVTVLATLAAAFGVGAVSGPSLVGMVGPEQFGVSFATFGAVGVTAAAALLVAGYGGEWVPPAQTSRLAAGNRLPLIAAFMVVLGLYVGMEAGIGGWLATHQVGLGVDPGSAARWTAGFWVTFTIGRALGAPLAHRYPERSVVPVLLGGAVVALAIAAIPGVSVVGYLLAGFVIALIFPTLLSWFTRAFGQPPIAVALLFVSGSVGAGVLPPVIGVLIDRLGVGAAPVSLAIIAATGCALSLILARALSPERHAAVAAS